jgi:hypothetical protein
MANIAGSDTHQLEDDGAVTYSLILEVQRKNTLESFSGMQRGSF